TIALDRTGFSDVSFRGEYPIGRVEYRAATVPLVVKLEAFSPFIPLNTDDSSLPATVMQFTLTNTSAAPVEAALVGTLENAVLLNHRTAAGTRRNRVLAGSGYTFLECSAEKANAPAAPKRPDVVFEDWNKDTYVGWQVEGTAFGSGPIKKSAIPSYQGDVGGDTERVANSHACAPGGNVGGRDGALGKLISSTFKIERDYIVFWIGGGNHKGKTCLNLVVNGKVAQSATGQANNKMELAHFDVRKLAGQEAHLEIVDDQKGPWGNIGVGRIKFSDQVGAPVPFEKLPDLGTLGLALLGAPAEISSGEAAKPVSDKLSGELGRKLTLAAGQSAAVTFVLAWHFPNLVIKGAREGGRFYSVKFADAAAVAKYIAENFERLAAATRLWRDVWYDSTLPFWFLDRTQLNTSILATSTCFRFASGRFWAWEGVGCCAGTCAHVWHYAHAMARQFPELERILREQTDFGLALQPDGAIHFRGENNNIPAIDAQAGSILRTLREHQMSGDDAFLKRVWPGVKRATDWLIAKDEDGDGIIVSNQHNTLDTDWFGPVAWLSGLYLAALAAAAAMGDEVGDAAYAEKCRAILVRGQKKIVSDLFDGEYFLNKVDAKHLDSINSGTGCEIDQVMGQSWTWQVGLPRVLPEKETRAALQSLWKYNFSPDVGPYREHYKSGRWYAMAGEAGLLMCSFPRNDWDYEQARGKGKAEWAAGYFNECMNGFEYQVAGHMVWENMLLEGFAVTRALHDRYHASRRNPWNEVECGDHYARSMASYGVFLAACGFEYHGPKGHLGFAPRITPENFKAPFTTAAGWGTYEQQSQISNFKSQIALKWGALRLRTLALELPEKARASFVRVQLDGVKVGAQLKQDGRRLLIMLDAEARLRAGQSLEVSV
ncbi:MAG: GH116 family glycosyl hydrolase, partial [Kiritimatiellaeota bacterium]|nr:GH116 family glycosyl hydrolase [Kiritimatiellota bacterium]